MKDEDYIKALFKNASIFQIEEYQDGFDFEIQFDGNRDRSDTTRFECNEYVDFNIKWISWDIKVALVSVDREKLDAWKEYFEKHKDEITIPS